MQSRIQVTIDNNDRDKQDYERKLSEAAAEKSQLLDQLFKSGNEAESLQNRLDKFQVTFPVSYL